MVNKSRKRIRKKSRKLSRQRRYSRKKSRSVKRKSRSRFRIRKKNSRRRSVKRKSKKKSRRRRSRGSSQRHYKFQMPVTRRRPPYGASAVVRRHFHRAPTRYAAMYRPYLSHGGDREAAVREIYTYLLGSAINSGAAKKKLIEKLIEKLKHITKTYKPWVSDGEEFPSFQDIYGHQGYPMSTADSEYSIPLMQEQVVDLLSYAEKQED